MVGVLLQAETMTRTVLVGNACVGMCVQELPSLLARAAGLASDLSFLLQDASSPWKGSKAERCALEFPEPGPEPGPPELLKLQDNAAAKALEQSIHEQLAENSRSDVENSRRESVISQSTVLRLDALTPDAATKKLETRILEQLVHSEDSQLAMFRLGTTAMTDVSELPRPPELAALASDGQVSTGESDGSLGPPVALAAEPMASRHAAETEEVVHLDTAAECVEVGNFVIDSLPESLTAAFVFFMRDGTGVTAVELAAADELIERRAMAAEDVDVTA